jgi:hypothetical protein
MTFSEQHAPSANGSRLREKKTWGFRSTRRGASFIQPLPNVEIEQLYVLKLFKMNGDELKVPGQELPTLGSWHPA